MQVTCMPIEYFLVCSADRLKTWQHTNMLSLFLVCVCPAYLCYSSVAWQVHWTRREKLDWAFPRHSRHSSQPPLTRIWRLTAWPTHWAPWSLSLYLWSFFSHPTARFQFQCSSSGLKLHYISSCHQVWQKPGICCIFFSSCEEVKRGEKGGKERERDTVSNYMMYCVGFCRSLQGVPNAPFSSHVLIRLFFPLVA